MKCIFVFAFRITPGMLIFILVCTLPINRTYCQNSSSPNEYTRLTNRKLKVLSSPSPDIAGGYVRNDSYEGIKGGPFLFNEFKPLIIRIKELEDYVYVEANLDLKTNSILYKDQELNQVFSIPSNRVIEVIFKSENETLIFKTTENKKFEPGVSEIKFLQVIKEGPDEFVKIPFKIFIPADYTGAYTAKRRFDEYKTEYNYYLLNSDNVYKRINLTKKSLIKVFPEKRELIKSFFKMSEKSDKEEIVLTLLDKL